MLRVDGRCVSWLVMREQNKCIFWGWRKLSHLLWRGVVCELLAHWFRVLEVEKGEFRK